MNPMSSLNMIFGFFISVLKLISRHNEFISTGLYEYIFLKGEYIALLHKYRGGASLCNALYCSNY